MKNLKQMPLCIRSELNHVIFNKLKLFDTDLLIYTTDNCSIACYTNCFILKTLLFKIAFSLS